MRTSNWQWRMAGMMGLAATLLFAVGFIYAVNDVMNPPASANNQPALEEPTTGVKLGEDGINIVALGDSLTKGTGDETGEGYVQNTKEILEKKQDKPVFIIGNYGINGYRTEQLLKDLRENKTMREMISQANVVLFTMGGNDLFQIAQNELDLTKEFDPAAIYARMPEPATRLDDMMQELNALNPKAAVIYVGLYNPFLDLDETGKVSEAINEWNSRAFIAANHFPNITVVSTFDLFERNLLKYLSSDHFHPNQAGYERIAERIVQALE